MIAEGTHMYRGRIFKIPKFLAWQVVVNDPKLVAEFRKIPEHIFSGRAALESIFQHEYTFHPIVTDASNPRYHISVIRSQLTRSIAKVMSEIHDEVLVAFDDYFPINTDGEWEKYTISEIIPDIVCRASNRVFIGLPLCRDPGFVALSVKRIADISKTAGLLNLCPKFPRRFVAPFVSDHGKQVDTIQRLLVPLIETRRQEIAENLKEDEGSDALAWLLRNPIGKNSSDVDLTCRVLILNLASIPMISPTFIHVLYDLAAYPEYAKPLREEVACVVKCDGWTKDALRQMDKIDSFIKESIRLNTLGELTMHRIAVEDYTFTQTGTFIPRGTTLSVASHDAHFDAGAYVDPTRFNGFRFANLKNGQAPDVNERHFDITTTGLDSLGFGYGIHACPGRFFAANILKLLLAHVVLKYDIKLRIDDGVKVRPPNKAGCMPDPTVKLFFRKRKN